VAPTSTGAIEIQTKATLLEGDIDSPGTAAALVQPDVRAGVVPTLFQAPRIADLIPTASTTSNRVRVIRESLATNAADTVEEGGEKPESALEFSEDDLDIRKVATFLPLSDELFSDSGAVQSYLNGRLSLFVQIKEDDSSPAKTRTSQATLTRRTRRITSSRPSPRPRRPICPPTGSSFTPAIGRRSGSQKNQTRTTSLGRRSRTVRSPERPCHRGQQLAQRLLSARQDRAESRDETGAPRDPPGFVRHRGFDGVLSNTLLDQ
jgi:hypothetical protein